ncbi:hypothetical protein LVB87_09060 [Lysobacter sp. KIS68-7]|nr:hypothetical protein [Lysobacter sp. KIS68-7]UHQ18370.1 hypothetical protein LVB87_09060 [Lysobacter sp. KIS68-7]
MKLRLLYIVYVVLVVVACVAAGQEDDDGRSWGNSTGRSGWTSGGGHK